MINDVASIFLWLIVAVFFLHVIEGNAREWVSSKFKVADMAGTGNFGTGSLGIPGNPVGSDQTGDRGTSGSSGSLGTPGLPVGHSQTGGN